MPSGGKLQFWTDAIDPQRCGRFDRFSAIRLVTYLKDWKKDISLSMTGSYLGFFRPPQIIMTLPPFIRISKSKKKIRLIIIFFFIQNFVGTVIPNTQMSIKTELKFRIKIKKILSNIIAARGKTGPLPYPKYGPAYIRNFQRFLVRNESRLVSEPHV